ncbi:MAG: hypothetical protein D6731_22205 [Planctomycetota bacterium]|nr:MAG: hypothetical protein D6731_22205 [Planctomycetota bacterium]
MGWKRSVVWLVGAVLALAAGCTAPTPQAGTSALCVRRAAAAAPPLPRAAGRRSEDRRAPRTGSLAGRAQRLPEGPPADFPASALCAVFRKPAAPSPRTKPFRPVLAVVDMGRPR